MFIGTLLTLLTGTVWTAVAICLTVARRSKCHVEHFYIVGSMGAAAIILAYQCLTHSLIPETWSWLVAGCMVASALFNGLSNICIMLNMGMGNAALHFALSRIGFSFSFLWCVIVWDEKMNVLNAVGILSLIAAVALTAMGKHSSDKKVEALNHKRLMLSLGCSLFSAISQICVIFPFSAGFDAQPLPAMTKTLILLVSNCIIFGAIALSRTYTTKTDMKKLLKCGLSWSVLCVISYACLFASLEQLGTIQRSGIVYPIGGAVQIFLFAHYSRFVWKEKLTPLQLLAMVLIIIGIIAVRL